MKTLLSLSVFGAIGILEIYLGIAKGMPISWVLGVTGVIFFLFVRFFTAVSGLCRAAFPNELPLPKVSPMTHNEFDSIFDNNKKGSNSNKANSNKANSNLYEDEIYNGLNGLGGYDELIREDNPFGEFR